MPGEGRGGQEAAVGLPVWTLVMRDSGQVCDHVSPQQPPGGACKRCPQHLQQKVTCKARLGRGRNGLRLVCPMQGPSPRTDDLLPRWRPGSRSLRRPLRPEQAPGTGTVVLGHAHGSRRPRRRGCCQLASSCRAPFADNIYPEDMQPAVLLHGADERPRTSSKAPERCNYSFKQNTF